ncbi:MAG: hypothetical protein M1274_10325 [Actinobacteria bacterium]|nr:hypothetical protein [Actinomycetota bacterium]
MAFHYNADDFKLYVEDTILVPTPSSPMEISGEVEPGQILLGYLLTWRVPVLRADHISLSYFSSDPGSKGFNLGSSITP